MLIEGRRPLGDVLSEVACPASHDLIARLAASERFAVQPLKVQLIVSLDGDRLGGFSQPGARWFLRIKTLIDSDLLGSRSGRIPEGFHWRSHPRSNPHLWVGGNSAAPVFEAALHDITGRPV
ncbi:hypothetical protein [Pseudoponticoccus marisrubri]|uniref:Uncharacterized protein n=1 Tax=Pseudoponticoccus marisrubri TaxID=1685382 RepID=A0A0W7WEA7_9RHOB|nr:hypothetical protein [Pseudoponticoccus marisrubri]KUF08820.1 hypothetical protein AVJ23_20685 [Pseudoponticoccus marisrubri]